MTRIRAQVADADPQGWADHDDRAEAEELLRTLFADTDLARKRAEDELVPDADPAVASIGHQIVGIVLRDLGETDAALSGAAHGPAAGAAVG